MGIKDWSPEERPRERLLMHGPKALSPAEMLAIFLRNGVKGKSAVDLGRELLKRFNGIRGLYAASDEELLKVPGMGNAKVATLRAVIGLNMLYLTEMAKETPSMIKPKEVFNLIQCSIEDHSREGFWVLLLDNKGKLIEIIDLPSGSVTKGSIRPKDIAGRIFNTPTAKLVLAHNHPSGDITPSEEDEAATRQVAQLCSALEVEFLDHMIVGRDKYFSFQRSGKLRFSDGR